MATDYIFGTTSALTGWTRKNDASSEVTAWDYGLDGDGFWVASEDFNVITTQSDSYEASLGADVSSPVLGTTGDSCVTAVSLTKTGGAKATLSVTAHTHGQVGQGNGSYSWDLSDYISGSGWGACTPPIGAALEDGAVVSWSLSAAIQHEELSDCNGDHLNAENYDPIIDVTVEIIGSTPLALTQDNITAGWELVSQETAAKSPGFTTSTTAARLHLAKPTPAS